MTLERLNESPEAPVGRAGCVCLLLSCLYVAGLASCSSKQGLQLKGASSSTGGSDGSTALFGGDGGSMGTGGTPPALGSGGATGATQGQGGATGATQEEGSGGATGPTSTTLPPPLPATGGTTQAPPLGSGGTAGTTQSQGSGGATSILTSSPGTGGNPLPPPGRTGGAGGTVPRYDGGGQPGCPDLAGSWNVEPSCRGPGATSSGTFVALVTQADCKVTFTQNDDRTPTQWVSKGTLDAAGKTSLAGDFGFTDSRMCDLVVANDGWQGVCGSATQQCTLQARRSAP